MVRRAVIPGHFAAIRFQPSVSGIRTANCVRPLVSSERAPSAPVIFGCDRAMRLFVSGVDMVGLVLTNRSRRKTLTKQLVTKDRGLRMTGAVVLY
jgi:hypothetical protein